MKNVFASKFLEPISSNTTTEKKDWTWTPENEEIVDLYASGGNTRSRQSTYASEKDDRSDDDRPNEGKGLMAS